MMAFHHFFNDCQALSTVKNMDRVYFMRSAGEIVASTHSVLAESDRKYIELFAGQMNGAEYGKHASSQAGGEISYR